MAPVARGRRFLWQALSGGLVVGACAASVVASSLGGVAVEVAPGGFLDDPVYADEWRGWPVAPVHQQHPIRGSFNDPRPSGFHIGVDINVPDDQPDAGAPLNRTHRVFAVEGGTVSVAGNVATVGCVNRVVRIGHFAYWHADPVGTVTDGQVVQAGDPIGWTCKGLWHVHLSEWSLRGGARTWVNPLRPGSKVAPYVDTERPVIRSLRFFAPANTVWEQDGAIVVAPASGLELAPAALRGKVDVRAEIADPQSFRGWLTGTHAGLYSDHHPYRVRLTVRRDGASGAPLLVRNVFRGERILGKGEEVTILPPTLGFGVHFAPETRQNFGAQRCADAGFTGCAGRFVLRLFSAPGGRRYWDTRKVANGSYRLTVEAFDAKGNSRTRSATVTVSN